MSKRKLIFGALGALLLAAVAVGFHGWRSGWFGTGDPVFTDVIPETRPTRLDHRQLERFSGQPIETILETLIAEKEAAAKTETPKSPVKSAEEALLDLLPDAPPPLFVRCGPEGRSRTQGLRDGDAAG